jgi:hypothetical protein
MCLIVGEARFDEGGCWDFMHSEAFGLGGTKWL